MQNYQLLKLIVPISIVLMPTMGSAQQEMGERSYDQVTLALFEGPASDKAPVSKPPHPKERATVNYAIYRDPDPYPVDPRKPCNDCTRQQGRRGNCGLLQSTVGFQGRPWQESEPGGCDCGKSPNRKAHPFVNVYWPNPLAGAREEFFPREAARSAATFERTRLTDAFDHLGSFRLLDYERTDNGHCGPGRDRYGCLGESRQFGSRVSGVGFREPGQPVSRGIPFP